MGLRLAATQESEMEEIKKMEIFNAFNKSEGKQNEETTLPTVDQVSKIPE
jgi:hypothetical protein